MNIIADENLFDPIISFLRIQGNNVISIREIGLSGISDNDIYQKAIAEHLVIVSMDKVFTQMLRFPPTKCGGIIVVKIYHKTVEETTALFIKYFNTINVSVITNRTITITPNRIRLRPLPKQQK